MTITQAINAALKLASDKRFGVYVLRSGEGYSVALWCDENPSAVVAVVNPNGSVAGY